MKVLDAGVLLAGHREDHPEFAVARAWLDDLLGTRGSFAVPDLVAGTFIRLATDPRVFTHPTPARDAFAYLHALRDQPGHQHTAPGERHLAMFERACVDFDAVGDLVPDAQLAALAMELGGEIVSFDRGFARFEGLRWSRPGAM